MERPQVVLVVRGTISLADALTDLSGHLVPFDGRPASNQSRSSSRSDNEAAGSEQVTCAACMQLLDVLRFESFCGVSRLRATLS